MITESMRKPVLYVIGWDTLKVLSIGTTTPSKILVRARCCGCDLQTGILLISIFGLLSSGHDGICSNCYAYQTFADIKKEGISTTEELPVSSKWFKSVIIFSFASIAFRAVSNLAKLLLWGYLRGTLKSISLAFPNIHFANRHFANWHLWAAFFRLWNVLNFSYLPNSC